MGYPGYNFINHPLFGGQQQMSPLGQQGFGQQQPTGQLPPIGGQQMPPMGGAQMSPMNQQPMQQPTGQLPGMGGNQGQSMLGQNLMQRNPMMAQMWPQFMSALGSHTFGGAAPMLANEYGMAFRHRGM